MQKKLIPSSGGEGRGEGGTILQLHGYGKGSGQLEPFIGRMTFLPIVARELRVASRRRATYWSRCITVIFALIIALVVYLNERRSPSATVGRNLFEAISSLAFIYCLAVGVRSTADCLSGEKREGTLGLLFLTDLKGYDVVAGKLVATSLNAFYGLLSMMPVLAIPLLMGGITQGEFWRIAFVLANTFLFSLAVGMFCSAISKYPRKAMGATLVLLLVFSMGIPVLQLWLSFNRRWPRLDTLCNVVNPGYGFNLASAAAYPKATKYFWCSVGGIHGGCWLFLLAAGLIVPRSWQDNPPGGRALHWRELWRRWSYGDHGERLAYRRRLLEINPFFWLAGRARLKPAHVWIVLAGLGCLWTWGALENRGDWLNVAIYVPTAMILNTVLKIWIASEAGQRLGKDRRAGALELLLSTPLSVPEILRGQMLALQRQFLGPLLTVLAVEFVFMAASLQNNRSDAAAIMAFWVAGMVMLVTDMLALCALGMWLSLTAKNPNRATGMAVRRVLVLPLAVGLGIIVFSSFAPSAFSATEPTWQFIWGLWFGLGMLTDLAFGLTAWRRLRTEFREAAAQRYAPTSLLPGRWWRGQDQALPNSGIGLPSS